MISRRAFLTAIAAAPIAALAPWRPEQFVGVDYGAGESSSLWLLQWREVDKFILSPFPDPSQLKRVRELLRQSDWLLEDLPWLDVRTRPHT